MYYYNVLFNRFLNGVLHSIHKSVTIWLSGFFIKQRKEVNCMQYSSKCYDFKDLMAFGMFLLTLVNLIS